MDATRVKKFIRYRRMIDSLLSRNGYADLVLKGGNIVNVFTRELYQADIAVKNEYILLVGDCARLIGPKTDVIDVSGSYLAPGFIDAHMHIESSMLTVTEFSRLSIPTGTTVLMTDPHEIGNVCGIAGIRAMIREAAGLPNHVRFAVPCLTPDVPGLETPGARLSSADIESLIEGDSVQGIGEMQGFSNVRPVYEHNEQLIDDLLASASAAAAAGKTVEGNAPGLSGAELAAHILVCGGKASCHETTTKEECVEKLRAGVTVFMREGSTERNMSECIRAVTEEGLDSRGLVLATDDMVAKDLIERGHMDEVIRHVIACGIDPVEAIQMATINPATHYGLKDVGALAPGRLADINVIDDLAKCRVKTVILGGKIAARNGEMIIDLPAASYPPAIRATVKRACVKKAELLIKARQESQKVRGIEIIPNQNLTKEYQCVMPVESGYVMPLPDGDSVPMVSVERHGGSGRIGKTFVRGLGIRAGAIALSVSHDSHNIIACGVSYDDLVMAVNRVIGMNGGIALIRDGKVAGDLPLPVAGLMTDELSGSQVSERIAHLCGVASRELGCTLENPFMHLSFLSLVTSPSLKLTDAGLIDTEKYTVVPTLL